LGLLSPVAALILLITGIGNIHNLYMGAPVAWYENSWLVVKIILFAVLLINGTLFGPMLSKSRMGAVKTLVENSSAMEHESKYASITKQVTIFYLVQTVLWFAIVYLSAFGPGKHPGII
jgi:hypothetical protein